MFLRQVVRVVAILICQSCTVVGIEPLIETQDASGSCFADTFDEPYFSLMQVAAGIVRSSTVLETSDPSEAHHKSSEDNRNNEPQPSVEFRFLARLGWAGAVGKDRLRGSMDEQKRRRKGGRLIFAAMLICFFLIFGFFWDDSELQGLPPKVAQRLLQPELWDTVAVQAPASKGKAKRKAAPSMSLSDDKMPKLAPAFVGTTAGTVVSIASDFLQASTWTVDVLGLMGVPVLTAQLGCANHFDHVLEVLSRDGAPLVSVNSHLQIQDAGGVDIGSLEPDGDGKFTFLSSAGSEVMSVTEDQHNRKITLTSVSDDGSASEPLGAAAWCNAASFGIGGERISGDRLEVSAKRGVDVVLMLICTLAVCTFGSSGRSGKQALRI